MFALLAGAINFTAAFAVPVPLIDKGVLAQIVGPLVTLVTQLAVLAAYRLRPTAYRRPPTVPTAATDTAAASSAPPDRRPTGCRLLAQ